MTTEIDKQLMQVVCICKGINLRRVLKSMLTCDSVSEINKNIGTGSGGCQGQRCGPRLCILLEKKKALQKESEKEAIKLD